MKNFGGQGQDFDFLRAFSQWISKHFLSFPREFELLVLIRVLRKVRLKILSIFLPTLRAILSLKIPTYSWFLVSEPISWQKWLYYATTSSPPVSFLFIQLLLLMGSGRTYGFYCSTERVFMRRMWLRSVELLYIVRWCRVNFTYVDPLLITLETQSNRLSTNVSSTFQMRCKHIFTHYILERSKYSNKNTQFFYVLHSGPVNIPLVTLARFSWCKRYSSVTVALGWISKSKTKVWKRLLFLVQRTPLFNFRAFVISTVYEFAVNKTSLSTFWHMSF